MATYWVAHGGSDRPRSGLSPQALLAVVPVACLAAAAQCVWLHATATSPGPFRASAAALLLVCGVLQALILWKAWRRGSAALQPLFLRRLFVGLVLCYVAGLAVGSNPEVRFLFQASLAAWFTLSIWPWVAAPRTLSRWSSWGGLRVARPLDRLVFQAALLLVVAELSLRGAERLAADGPRLDLAAQSLKLPPGAVHEGRRVNALGYWDDEFQMDPSPGVFRIAVLGHGVTLSGTAETNCLEQLERQAPGVEVYNFGMVQAGPREFAAQLTQDVAPFRPDLVLVFFSICDDVTHAPAEPGAFDWRGLSLAQWSADLLPSAWRQTGAAVAGAAAPADLEQYLRLSAPRLAVCRTPIESRVERHWREALSHLTDLVQQCRRRDLPAALVLAPAEYQVNAQLLDALRRRSGFEADQLDLELPQRRLKRFADEQQMPLVDLLPYFRASDESPYQRHNANWNETGHRLASHVIGGWLRSRFGQMIAAGSQASAE